MAISTLGKYLLRRLPNFRTSKMVMDSAVMTISSSERNLCSRLRNFWHSKLSRKVHAILAGFVVVLMLVCFIGIMSASITQHTDTENKPHAYPHVEIKAAMNLSEDPCEDFYSYACGNWPSKSSKFSQGNYVTAFTILQSAVNEFSKEIFTNAKISSDFPEIVNNALKYHESCLSAADENYIAKVDDTLQLLIDEIGGWPLLGQGEWTDAGFSWDKSCSSVVRWIGVDTVMSIEVGVDDTDSSKNILLIKAPQFQTLAFDDYSVKVILYCITQLLNSTLSDDEFQSEVEEMSLLEKRLSQFKDVTVDPNNTNDHRKMTVADLQKEVPGIDWLVMIQRMTNQSLGPESCFSENDSVLVGDVKYLRKVVEFLNGKNVKKKTIANLMGWFVVRELYAFLPGVLIKYCKHFGYADEENKALVRGICFEKSSELFSDALGYLYIKNQKFDVEAGAELVSYIKRSFSSAVEASQWLDDLTKKQILGKVEAMYEVIGYPNLFYSKQKLDNSYPDFPTMTSNSVHNFLLTWKYFVERNLKTLKIKNNFNNWILPRPVTYVGAYYVVDRNVIVLPMAVQNPPFFYLEGPRYINFGAIGSMIGHEINHAYDNIGRKRDKSGTVSKWWSPEAVFSHDKQLSCFKKQFGKYPIEGTGMMVNATKTLGENAADSPGVEQAYQAYKLWEKDNGKEKPYPGLEHLTTDQMFFVAFASQYCASISQSARVTLAAVDTHSPPKYRVIGSLSNSKSFAKAFSCKVGSPMNPVEKCTLW